MKFARIASLSTRATPAALAALLLATAVVTFCASAFATTSTPAQATAKQTGFDISLELFQEGRKVSSPHLTLEEGKHGTIRQGNGETENFIEVLATSTKDNAIEMKFKVGYRTEIGEVKVIAQPTIVAKDGEPAKVEFSQSPGKPADLTLSVLAKKVTL